MPTPTEILDGLTTATAQGWIIAVAWHIAMLIAIIAIALGWRPGRRLAGVLLATPLVTVSIMAWLVANPFNGTVFALLAVALILLALRLPRDAVAPAPRWAVIAGALMVIFGWIYPHFVSPEIPLGFLYRSPFGLVPCPTLSGVIGFALLANGLSSRAWSGVLAVAGLFYAIVGAFRLGVQIDLVLLAGAVALAVLAVRPDPENRVWFSAAVA